MAFLHFAPLLVAFAVFGINTCSACSGDDIQACVMPMQQMAQSGSKMGDMKTVCAVVKEATDCMRREMTTCPESMKSAVDAANSAINTIGQACSNPDSVNLEDMESCDNDQLMACSRELQKSASNKREACLAVGKARTCLKEFTDGCKSDVLVDSVKSQSSALDDAEEMCHDNGYATTGENAAGMNSPSTVLALLAMTVLGLFRYYL